MRADDPNEKLRVCFGEVWEREATNSGAWLIWEGNYISIPMRVCVLHMSSKWLSGKTLSQY